MDIQGLDAVKETTRRGAIAGAILLMGLGSSYRVFRPDESPDEQVDPNDGNGGTASPVGALYVETEVADLPDEPEQGSFAVTGDGIFTFAGSDPGWQPVQYGSRSNPVPSIAARSAWVGDSPATRPLISNGERTVYVDPEGGDDRASGSQENPLATIQEALSRAPIYLRDQFVVDLATVPETPVTYDEDVLVPAVVATGQAGQEANAPSAGPFINLVIRGNRNDPRAVSVGSCMFGNVVGTAAGNLEGVTILRNSPYDDEEFGVSAYGDGEVKLSNIDLTAGPTNGVLAYGARMKASRVNFGNENLAIGFKGKRHASAMLHNPSGTLTSDAFRATANSMISLLDGREVSGNPVFNTLRGGLIYDEVSGTWIGLSGNARVDEPKDIQATSSEQLPVRSGSPDDATPGEMWYDDGSGDVSEGVYAQMRTGAKRID